MAKLPKADNAIIAEHEAGKHDVYNGGYPTKGPQPATCRDCAKRAKDAEAAPVRTVTEPVVEAPAGKVKERTVRKVVTPKQAVIIDIVTKAEVAPVPSTFATREEWMLAAVEAMRPWMLEVDAAVGPVRISFGWPGGRGNKQGVRGQCWMPEAVRDSVPAIFISPAMEVENVPTILGIILHEMNHAAGHFGHTGAFAKTAAALGFVKPWTSSEGKTPDLQARLEALALTMGPLDHGAITAGHGLKGTGPTAPAVQSTRMLKVYCPYDGYTLRATKRWLETAIPLCPLCESIMMVQWS